MVTKNFKAHAMPWVSLYKKKTQILIKINNYKIQMNTKSVKQDKAEA